MDFILKTGERPAGNMDAMLEVIPVTASTTTVYVYGAGVDTPTNALGTGSYQLAKISTILACWTQQKTATGAVTEATISSEETQNDLITFVTGNGDEYDVFVLGYPEET